MCWSAHRYYRFEDRGDDGRRSTTSASGANDPVSTPGHLRVSDAERNRVVEVLKQHTADGRLTLDEFETRVEETLAARTGTELQAALRESPSLATERRRRPAGAARPDAAATARGRDRCGAICSPSGTSLCGHSPSSPCLLWRPAAGGRAPVHAERSTGPTRTR